MNDNFDLQKYLKESKALVNQNPFLAESYTEFQRADQGEKGVMAQDTAEEDIYGAGVEAGKHDAMRKKIREYILAEIAEEVTTDNADQDDAALNLDYDPLYENEDDTEDDDDYSDYFFDIDTEEDLEEAKKKKKKEDVKDVEDVNIEDTTDLSIDDLDMGDGEMAPEDAPETDMPDMGANLDGKEKDIMSHLMKALEIAKSEGNEKVITQISNTLKFFISEYIAQ
jgi:hypothetical protein